MESITSAANEKIKAAKKLQRRQQREKQQAFLLEGVRAVKDAIAGGAAVSMIFCTGPVPFDTGDIPCYLVNEKLYAELAETVTPQSVLAVVQMPPVPAVAWDKASCVLFCDGVQDPGNLGTLIRTADSAGVDAVILSKGCVDLYNPKTIRATMSSIFNIPVLQCQQAEQQLAELQQAGFTVVGSALSEASQNLYGTDLRGKNVIIVGNEANGVSASCLACCDKIVKIPMRGGSESLNVAVAASVLIYENLRQNRL